ncbi:MAG TPA: protein phosphatase 2C domain-containing protein [Polyangiaceae bacterium]|jgi:protein phosphatase|nr:protein phosphatase 2C domain-containing protein [Polyangiaceae bacterium]
MNDKTEAADVELDVAGLTDIGKHRERNEDQFLVATMQRTLHVEASSDPDQVGWLPGALRGHILLVADGMGGAAGGDIASRVAMRAIAEYLCNVMPIATGNTALSMRAPGSTMRPSTSPGVRQGLKSAIQRGDDEVRRAAQEAGEQRMGTTLTMTYISWPQLYVAHVGDSRAYLLRDDELVRLTTDHTYAEKLRERTSVALDENSPWHHVLWNALGGDPREAVEPELHRWQLEPGDVVMLCSDGLTKHVQDQTVAKVLHRAASAEEACKRLVKKAIDDGGSDNVTVVVARCVQSESASEAPTVKRR